MAQEQATLIEANASDTIETLVKRISESGARNVTLRLPQSVSVLTSLPDFEQLRVLERSSGVRLSIAPDANDKTRSGLAKILGFNVLKEAGSTNSNRLPALSDEPAPASPPPLPRNTSGAIPRPAAAPAAATPPAPMPAPPPMPILSKDVDVRDAPFAADFAFTPPAAALASTPDEAISRAAVPADIEELNAAFGDPDLDIPSSRQSAEAGSRPRVLGSTAPSRSVDQAPRNSAQERIAQKRKLGGRAPEAQAATVPVSVPSRKQEEQGAANGKSVAAATMAAPTSTGRLPSRNPVVLRQQRASSRRLLYTSFILIFLCLLVGAAGLWFFNQGQPASATVTLVPRSTVVSQAITVPIQVAVLGQQPTGGLLLAPAAQEVPPATLPSDIPPAQPTVAPASDTPAPLASPTAPANDTPPANPSATVSPVLATPMPAPVLPVSVAAVPIQAAPLEATVSASGTVQTTGFRDEPRGNDVTRLQLTNTSGQGASIPAGTQLQAANGATFSFAAAVYVPGTNYDTLTFGTALADVRAAALGPSGVKAYAMAGSIGALRYRNITNAAGGSTERIAQVSQGDYDNLLKSLSEQANRDAPLALKAQVQPGQQLLEDTIIADPPAATADRKPGEDATSLTLAVAVRVRANAFRPDEAKRAAQDAATQSLTAAAFSLNQGSLTVQDGSMAVEQDAAGKKQYLYRAAAQASVTYQISPDMQTAILRIIQAQNAKEFNQATVKQQIMTTYAAYLSDLRFSVTPGQGGFNPDNRLDQQDRVRVQVEGQSGAAAASATPPALPAAEATATPAQ